MHHRQTTSATGRSAARRPSAPGLRAALRARYGRRDAVRVRAPSDVELRRRTVAAIERDVHRRLATAARDAA